MWKFLELLTISSEVGGAVIVVETFERIMVVGMIEVVEVLVV